MRSLRARLLAGLLSLAAVGLLLLAGITYGEQRTFLYDRLDQQARAAVPAVSLQLRGGLPRSFPGGAPPGSATAGPGRAGPGPEFGWAPPPPGRDGAATAVLGRGLGALDSGFPVGPQRHA